MRCDDNLVAVARVVLKDCRETAAQLSRGAKQAARALELCRNLNEAPVWSAQWMAALDRLQAARRAQAARAPQAAGRGSRAVSPPGRPHARAKTGPTPRPAPPRPRANRLSTHGPWDMAELVRASAEVWVDLADVEDDQAMASAFRIMALDLEQLAQLLDAPPGSA
jgi:hypothetical protein